VVYKSDSTSERTSPSERSRRSRQENRGAFAGPYRSGMGSGGGTGSNCDVTPDGRFVMIRDEESSNLVVLNWLEELERLVPNGKVVTTLGIEKTHRAGHVCQDLVLEQLGEDECMAVQAITVDMEACEILSRYKEGRTSFSQVIKDELRKKRTGRDVRHVIERLRMREDGVDAVEAQIRRGAALSFLTTRECA